MVLNGLRSGEAHTRAEPSRAASSRMVAFEARMGAFEAHFALPKVWSGGSDLWFK
ncbi:hypothetical protein HanPSC8_Chr01g0038401 [Helianthus annuus]|nr:hypothetical protein HanPSC8_Chr01g0038401 [Helianthus annuus]